MDSELPDVEDSKARIEITEADLVRAPEGGTPPARPVPPSLPLPRGPIPASSTPPAYDGRTAHEDSTETTRLLCAAAYLDGVFAQDVVDEVVHERHRAVAIPPGIDIGAVVKHCIEACRQKLVRDVLLTATLLFTVVLFVVERGSPKWLVIGFVVAWAIVFWDIWSAIYFVIVKRLSAHNFSSQGAPSPADPVVARRVEELEHSQRGNLTVYSGFLPFSGAGYRSGGWSFAVDLRRGKETTMGECLLPERLTPTELYDGVQSALSALGMANLEVSDRLFVSGSDIRDDRTLLPDPLRRPLWQVDPRMVDHYLEHPTHWVRHYRCIQVVDWRGELVVSLFLRFGIKNARLFCELSEFLLFPLKDEFHRYDALGGKLRFRHVVSMAGRSLLATPGLSLRAPKVIWRPLVTARDRSRGDKRVEQDPYFDYGAPFTALDRARSIDYRRYFQQLDREMYVKVLERTVMDAIVEVLDEHDISTTDLVKTGQNIINNGVMMSGGNFNARDVTTGRTNFIDRVKGATGAASS